jgi:cyanate permease
MAGGGGLYGRLTADMLARVSPAHTSTAGGISAAAQSITHIIANPLVGKVVDVTHSYDAVLVTLGVIVIPGAIAWIVWPMSTQEHAVPDPQRP